MQINVDDEVFHKWALSLGYVRLTDISEFVACRVPVPTGGRDEVIAAAWDTARDSLAADVAALEQLDDLKPTTSLKEATDALRAVLDFKGAEVAKQLLADFGAAKIGDVPEARRAEFKAAAERLMS